MALQDVGILIFEKFMLFFKNRESLIGCMEEMVTIFSQETV